MPPLAAFLSRAVAASLAGAGGAPRSSSPSWPPARASTARRQLLPCARNGTLLLLPACGLQVGPTPRPLAHACIMSAVDLPVHKAVESRSGAGELWVSKMKGRLRRRRLRRARCAPAGDRVTVDIQGANQSCYCVFEWQNTLLSPSSSLLEGPQMPGLQRIRGGCQCSAPRHTASAPPLRASVNSYSSLCSRRREAAGQTAAQGSSSGKMPVCGQLRRTSPSPPQQAQPRRLLFSVQAIPAAKRRNFRRLKLPNT